MNRAKISFCEPLGGRIHHEVMAAISRTLEERQRRHPGHCEQQEFVRGVRLVFQRNEIEDEITRTHFGLVNAASVHDAYGSADTWVYDRIRGYRPKLAILALVSTPG